MNRITDFLKSQIAGSISRLVKSAAEALKTSRNNSVVAVKATAAIAVMKAMGMAEELRLFRVLVISLFGEKGIPVPGAIMNMFAQESVLAPVVSKPATPITKSLPATMPARILDRPVETPEQRRDKFLSILTGFLAGKRIDIEKTRGFLASVFKTGVGFSRENWETIFLAMKKAAANSFYLLDNTVGPAKFFAAAPVELVDEYIFGQDGAMVLTLADLRELEAESMPGWLVAKTSILLDGVLALDETGKLDESTIRRVESLYEAIQKVDGPEFLVEKIRTVLSTDEADRPVAPATDKIENGGPNVRIVGNLMGVVIASEAAKAAERETATSEPVGISPAPATEVGEPEGKLIHA